VVAANRDEFYARPSAAIARWPDAPHVIGGRDLEAGGTWLGITDSGRFAAVTNVREPGMAQGVLTRGALARNFLTSELAASDYALKIDNKQYSGFNLLLADGEELVYCTNRDGPPRSLSPGIYGLSNHLLDSPWPKLITARRRFATALPELPDTSPLFELLADAEIVPDYALPDTGISLEWERLLSAIFVQSAGYGTRASTVTWLRHDGVVFVCEKTFGPNGQAIQSSVISTGV
ncbi:MAG: NRDE family protein, partial [Dechloromonas sp.]|nr:NRDE family protein [Dechloromonas sp.]